jgi:hypothetical protein
MMPVDFTHLSVKNKKFSKGMVTVANGTSFVTLAISKSELAVSRQVIYLHIHRDTKRCYVGITEQDVKSRWYGGTGYRTNRRFGSAIAKYGWQEFDSHILAFCEDREQLNAAEITAIAAAGGHKSKYTFNLSSGGDLVADNDKPVIGVFLETGHEKRFKSAVDAARQLGMTNIDKPAAIARKEKTSSTEGWWFRFEDDIDAKPPEEWGESYRLNQVKKLQGKKVIAIHFDTKEEKHFNNQDEAAKSLGVHKSLISQVAVGGVMSANGWWIKFEDDDRPMPEIYGTQSTRAKRDKKVYASHLKTGEKLEFRNCTVADNELKLHKGAAAAVASGDRASTLDWWFSYKKDVDPPKEYRGALVAKARSKAIVATEMTTGKEVSFDSAKEAALQLCMSRASISYVISGKLGSVKGYKFRFA